jgi:nucleoside 2-deoxyribosyltransferase
VTAIAARLKLDVPSARGQYYGQARWDALRACHGGVFDLRGHRPGLVRADAAAAAALAGTAYELGLACALGKPVVIVTDAGDVLPFDVDIAPCELTGDPVADEQALSGAIDHAWYGRQRTTNASSLADTLAFLDTATREHPRRRLLEVTGALDQSQIDDPIGFAGCVKQTLREQGLGDLQVIFPAWPGRYPDAEAPTVFHVMPFAEPWSNEARDAVRTTASARGYLYRRGDESDEGRIIQAIWDDITAAHLVVVDLTGLNLNVSIELGMAHALGRAVVMVRRAGIKETLPRNIEKLRVLEYDGPGALARLIETRLVRPV